MSNVSVPDVKVNVVVAGTEVARFTFNRIHLAPQNWETTAALISADARPAARACLLAAVAELASDGWEVVAFAFEGGGETNDQPQLPWE